MEKLSVIIPAYQAEKYLAEAVASVHAQGWQGEVEIAIIDDGSADNTPAIAKELGNIVLSQSRGGAARARNAGLRATTGEWVLLLDADDVLTDGALSRLLEEFEKQPELMAAFGKAVDFISPELTDEQRRELQPRPDSYGGVLPGCSLIRRRVFEEIGLFDESLNSGETVAWQMKLRDAKLPTISIDFVTLKRRIHMTNTGRVSAKQEMLNYAAILRRRMQKK